MRFLLRPRWIALVLTTIVLAVTFVSLGFWQLDRLEQRREDNDAISAAHKLAPAPVGELLRTDSRPCSCVEFKRVTATGSYDRDHQILIRNRSADDRPGFFVVTPLQTAAGVLLVARGWIPPSSAGADTAPEVPAAPAGQVTVTGRVRLTESGGSRVQLGEYPALTRINVSTIAKLVAEPTYRAYVELTAQDPAAAAKPALIEEPPLDEGPHLSYAVQWFLFATIAVGGCALLIYRAARGREGQPHLAGSVPAPRTNNDDITPIAGDEGPSIAEGDPSAAATEPGRDSRTAKDDG